MRLKRWAEPRTWPAVEGSEYSSGIGVEHGRQARPLLVAGGKLELEAQGHAVLPLVPDEALLICRSWGVGSSKRVMGFSGGGAGGLALGGLDASRPVSPGSSWARRLRGLGAQHEAVLAPRERDEGLVAVRAEQRNRRSTSPVVMLRRSRKGRSPCGGAAAAGEVDRVALLAQHPLPVGPAGAARGLPGRRVAVASSLWSNHRPRGALVHVEEPRVPPARMRSRSVSMSVPPSAPQPLCQLDDAVLGA